MREGKSVAWYVGTVVSPFLLATALQQGAQPQHSTHEKAGSTSPNAVHVAAANAQQEESPSLLNRLSLPTRKKGGERGTPQENILETSAQLREEFEKKRKHAKKTNPAAVRLEMRKMLTAFMLAVLSQQSVHMHGESNPHTNRHERNAEIRERLAEIQMQKNGMKRAGAGGSGTPEPEEEGHGEGCCPETRRRKKTVRRLLANSFMA